MYGAHKLIGDNVYSSLRPLHVLTVVFGVTCYTTSIGKLEPGYEVTKISVLRCVFIIGVYALGLYSTWDSSSLDLSPGSSVLVQMQECHQIISNCVGAVHIILGFIMCNKVIEIVRQIDDIDKIFYKHGLSVDFRKIFIHACLLCAGFVLYVISYVIFIIITNDIEEKLVIVRIISGIPYFLKIIQELQLYYYMKNIELRFSTLNDSIRTGKYHQELGGRNVWRSTDEREHPLCPFDTISSAHLKLCETALLLNRTYTVQLLLLITCCFTGSVSALYLLLVGMEAADRHRQQGSWNTIYVLWSCSNAIELMAIVFMACKTCYQSAATPKIYHRIRNNVYGCAVQDVLETYSVHMHHYRLQFDVCGLFALDYSLLNTITAGVTMYLVILVQFHVS